LPKVGSGYPNVVDAASQYLGVPYVYGGDNPRIGLDCSAFIQHVFADVGIKLPRTTFDQVKHGQKVNGIKNLRPGDVIFTEPTPDGPGHVGLYLGNGIVQESPHTGLNNKKISLKAFLTDGLVAIRRYGAGGGGNDVPVTASDHEKHGFHATSNGQGPGFASVPDIATFNATPEGSTTQEGAQGLESPVSMSVFDTHRFWSDMANQPFASPETRQFAQNAETLVQGLPQ